MRLLLAAWLLLGGAGFAAAADPDPCAGGNCVPGEPERRFNDFSTRGIGTTSGDFLITDIGARGMALGGAYSAVSDDSYSIYWNPAGLARVPRFSSAFQYTRYVEDINYQSGSAAWRLNDVGVIGAGFRYRDLGEITHTDLGGNTVGRFRPRDYIGELAWGQKVFDLSDGDLDVSMGVSGKWLHQDYLLHADSFSGDIGIQSRFYTGRRSYDFAFVAQNMGLGPKFDQIRDTLPFRARFGGAFRPWAPLLLSVDWILPINNTMHGALGAEYTWTVARNLKAALRGGFNSLTVEDLGVLSTPSGGFGVVVGDLSFDYAFSPLGVLGDQLHRFSISFNLPSKASRRYRER